LPRVAATVPAKGGLWLGGGALLGDGEHRLGRRVGGELLLDGLRLHRLVGGRRDRPAVAGEVVDNGAAPRERRSGGGNRGDRSPGNQLTASPAPPHWRRLAGHIQTSP
jgi:hypothetical protein